MSGRSQASRFGLASGLDRPDDEQSEEEDDEDEEGDSHVQLVLLHQRT